ncbi:MAG: hypothetical protein DRN96_03370 [Thermoproteota archaeon]|nr:MAG: hypothetical protein DRN96_03370 [Candidatus Korarchaeota archaeon]
MEVSGVLYHCSYSRGAVRLYVRGDSPYTIVVRYLPYFILVPNRVEQAKSKLASRAVIEEDELYVDGVLKPVFKVRYSSSDERRQLVQVAQQLGECRETDIEPWYVYLLESGITPLAELSARGDLKDGVLYAEDVEVRSREPPVSLKTVYFTCYIYSEHGYPRKGEDPVLVAGFRGSSGTEVYEASDGDDRELLASIAEYIREQDPDVIVGYEQDADEWPYIIARAKRHGLKLRIGRDLSEPVETGKYFRGMILKETEVEGRANIDLFSVAWRDFPELPTKSIEEVAEALGIECPKLPPSYMIKELWRERREELKAALEERLSLIEEVARELLPLQLEFSRLTGVPLHYATRMTVGELVDSLVLREAYRRRAALPDRGAKKAWFPGGFVWLKKPGVYESVGSLDFKSMYPTLIKNFNISPETVGCKCCREEAREVEAEGERFKVCSKRKGLLPDIVEELLELRAQLKREMAKHPHDSSEYKRLYAKQHAVKVVTNAIYGYMGWANSRLYTADGAKLTTALGRKYIQEVRKLAESRGLTPVYIDTDGIHIAGVTEEQALKLVDEVNSKMPVTIEFEHIARRALYLTKKKYVHLVDGRLVAKGFEFVRKDYPAIVKEAQKAVVEAILRDGDLERARRVAEEYRARLERMEVSKDDLVMVEQLAKKLEEYERTTKASAAARWLQENAGVEVHRGMNLYILVIKGSEPVNYRARPAEFFELEDCDISYYLELFDKVVERTLAAAREVKTKPRAADLTTFFS